MDKLALNIGDEFGSPWGREFGLGSLVSIVVSAGITIGGIIVIFLLIFGGLAVIKGAGSGDSRSAAQGKQAITFAIIGFIIVFGAYWVVRFLEAISGNTFLTNPLP